MIGLLLLLTIAGQDDLCAEGFVIETAAVDYPRALASETLTPTEIELEGKPVRLGQGKAAIDDAVGKPGKVVKDWELRSEQDQCAALIGLLRTHPNSMHLYVLGGLRAKRMSGAFRTVEWPLPRVGLLRGYFRKGKNGADEAYLLHLSPTPVPLGRIHSAPTNAHLLIRAGKPSLSWDTASNRVSVR